MSDTFKKVKSGDKLRIPAATYNAFIDTALDYQSRQRNISSTPQAVARSSGMILVRNDTGTDLDRYSVLGIDRPIIMPGDNLDSFKNKVALIGVIPRTASHQGKYVITWEPLKSSAIGLAYAAGVCPVKVDVSDAATQYPCAEIVDGVTANLEARSSGSATILWREGGTGVQWALVAFGSPDGRTDNPSTLGAASEGSETADTHSWARDTATSGDAYGATPLDLWFVSRMGYFPSGDKKIYQYMRKATFNTAGLLVAISAETRVEVDAPEAC